MAVSKRTRYEVLRRDNHACRYCGAAAPGATLTVDHVTPVALGGTDDPSNLVAACKDCNAGKSSTAPGAEIVNQVADDAIRWAAAIREAAREAEDRAQRHVATHEAFVKRWRTWDEGLAYLPGDCWATIDGWMDAGITERLLLEALEIAIGNRSVPSDGVFRYMGGIIRNRLAELHERAREILAKKADAPAPAHPHCEHCNWDDPEHAEQHAKPCSCQGASR